eukprot:gene10500-9234_t
MSDSDAKWTTLWPAAKDQASRRDLKDGPPLGVLTIPGTDKWATSWTDPGQELKKRVSVNPYTNKMYLHYAERSEA